MSLVVLSVYVAAIGFLLVWFGTSPTAALRDQLPALSPRAIEASFLLLAVGAVAARHSIARSLSGVRLRALALAVLAFVLVSILPPRTHRIYYDEDIYQGVAQNIVWAGRAEMCNEGTLEQGEFRCRAAEYNKEPNAFPFLLSLVFRLAGVSEPAAHVLNRLLFALGAAVTFWIGLLLFEDRYASGAAALAFALTPQNLLWGATVAVEPGAAVACGLAVGSWLLFLKDPRLSTGALAAASLSFAAQWRPESILVVAVAGVATLSWGEKRFMDRRVYAAGAAALVLLVVHFAHIWAVRGEGWGSPETGKFAWSYVSGNLRTNALYFIEGRDFPILLTVLAMLALFMPLLMPMPFRKNTVPLTWFVLFFGIFIPFHAGSYRYGADVRFSLLTVIPLALLAGRGASGIRQALESYSLKRAGWVPIAAVVYAFSPYLPLVRALGTEAWAARADHTVAREFLSLVPERSIVLTHNPGMLHVMGQSAAQASIGTYRPNAVNEYFVQFPGGVYFHFNFWCNVTDPVQQNFCTTLLATYPTQVLAERSAGFYRYVLYRLMPPLRHQTSP